ncbi:MAG: DEAD/DEAH box helicase family protein, partial [Candidatus Kapaibacteriota bacterium]
MTKHLLKNGNTLAILFDTDFAGIDAAKRLAASLNTSATQHSTLNTQHLDLPRLARQETKDAPKPQHNDLADYICQYGFDDALTALLAQPQLARRSTVQRGNVAVPALTMTVQSTLSETPQHTAILNAALGKHHRLALYAPTGCGKTYTLLRHIAPHRQGRTIFTVPTVALAEQIDREYGYGSDGYNANSAVGASACKLVCITGKDDTTTLMEARTSAKIIVCTYNSLHKVLFGTGKDRTTSLLDDDTLLVVDEAHKLHEEYGFRREAVLSVFNALRTAKHSLLMSATPSLLWHDDRSLPYTQMVVRVRERNTICCQPLYYNPSSATSPSAAAIHATVRLILHKRAKAELGSTDTGVIAVRLNNNKSLRAIQEALATLGIPAVNVDRITAKSRDTSDAYKSIMQHGRINVPIILTTSALDCGVNIYNTNIQAAIVVDETNPNAIEQFANRFRRMNTVPLFVLNSSAKRQTTLPFPFAPKDYFERNALNAETQAQIYAHTTGRDQPSHRGISSRSKFAELNDAIYWHHGEYVVNTPALIADTEALSLRSGRSFLDDLAHAGMTVLAGETLEDYCLPKDTPRVADTNNKQPSHEYHEQIAAATSAAHHHQQTSAHQHKALFFTMLAETPALLAETLWHTSFDAALKLRIGMLFAISPRNQSEESKALAHAYADLWLTNAPERRAKRYCDLRALHFDHTAASALCERFDDDRRWKNFMENLAMHQRLHLDTMSGAEQPLSKHLLSKIDREKLRREKEIRAMVASSAEAGFVFEGATTRHIPNALHTKAALT